jgi:hypothetical protein
MVELTVPVVTVVTGRVDWSRLKRIGEFWIPHVHNTAQSYTIVVILGICLGKNLCFFDGARLALLFHIANDGLPAVIYVNMLDADKLLTAITQASANFHLHCEGFH